MKGSCCLLKLHRNLSGIDDLLPSLNNPPKNIYTFFSNHNISGYIMALGLGLID